MPRDLAALVLEDAVRWQLFPVPGIAVLAVSGGPDSVALLDLFATHAAQPLNLELVVAHVDHGIASDSADVARRVRALAEQYGRPCHTTRLELGPLASETDAREARYEALRKIQHELGARYLVTAHHADDQVETILYRVLRGSGPAGLAGMARRGRQGLIRPLLDRRRTELVAWARRVGWSHEDPANRDPRHARSWLRTELLPVLIARFPDVEERLLDVGRHATVERNAWSLALREIRAMAFERAGQSVSVAVAPFLQWDDALASTLLRALAREVGVVVGPKRAAQLLAFVRGGGSGRVFQLDDAWNAELVFDRLHLTPGVGETRPAPYSFGFRAPDTFRVGGWEFLLEPDAAERSPRASLSTWIEPRPGEVRLFEVGDRMRPLGGPGRRKVRRLLMEARVPVRDRRIYPVVVQDGRIVWVPGICRSANAVPSVGAPAWRLDARRLEG